MITEQESQLGSQVSKETKKQTKHRKLNKEVIRREGIVDLALLSQASLGTGCLLRTQCHSANRVVSSGRIKAVVMCLETSLEEEAPFTAFSKGAQKALSILELRVDWEEDASPK